MSDGQRRRLPLPLPLPLPMDDADERVLAKTMENGGVKPSGGSTRQVTFEAQGDEGPEHTTPVNSDQTAPTRTNEKQPEDMFTRNDLRPQISQTSALATAMAEVFASLDPAARKYIKPASVLKDFLAEHDAELAELFRGSTNLK